MAKPKEILADVLARVVTDKLTSAGGAVAGTVAATLPAMAGGDAMTVSDDPAILIAQVISGLVSLALLYWDRSRKEQK